MFFAHSKIRRRNAVLAALQFTMGLVAGLGLVWAALFLQTEPDYLAPAILVFLSLALALLITRRLPSTPFHGLPALLGVLSGVLAGFAGLFIWVLVTVPGD